VCFAFAGEEMSSNNHGKLMSKLFADLGVETAKLTHEMRIFASQLMYEMGVPLEVRQARASCLGVAACHFVLTMHCMLHDVRRDFKHVAQW
jgi:hypothetical protein